MEDFEKEGEETSARGVDWEVVSLTASAYAAAPGPEGIDLADDGKDKQSNKNDEEYSQMMFMSGHFVSLPNKHENLPTEHDDGEILTKSRAQDVDMIEVEAHAPEKTLEENWNSGSISEVNDLHVVQFFNKGERLCAHNVEFEEDTTTLQGLNLVGEVKGMCSDSGFSSFHTETGIGGSVLYDENSGTAGSDVPIGEDPGCSPKPVDGSKYNVSGIPIESWWKKRAALLYAHAKEASTFWSLCVAAALMGIAILGQRWQRERWQVYQIRSQFIISEEKISRLLSPVTRFKDVLVGGPRRAPVLQGGPSSAR